MNSFLSTSGLSYFFLTSQDIFGPTVAMTMPGISQLKHPA